MSIPGTGEQIYLNIKEPLIQEVKNFVREQAMSAVLTPTGGKLLEKGYELESRDFPVKFTKGDEIYVNWIAFMTKDDVCDMIDLHPYNGREMYLVQLKRDSSIYQAYILFLTNTMYCNRYKENLGIIETRTAEFGAKFNFK